MDRDEILKFLETHKSEITEKFQVSKIGLFGSYAINQQTEESDIDLIVSMPSDFDLYYDFKEYLENEFHKTIDLGLEKNVRELVKRNIEHEILYV